MKKVLAVAAFLGATLSLGGTASAASYPLQGDLLLCTFDLVEHYPVPVFSDTGISGTADCDNLTTGASFVPTSVSGFVGDIFQQAAAPCPPDVISIQFTVPAEGYEIPYRTSFAQAAALQHSSSPYQLMVGFAGGGLHNLLTMLLGSGLGLANGSQQCDAAADTYDAQMHIVMFFEADSYIFYPL